MRTSRALRQGRPPGARAVDEWSVVEVIPSGVVETALDHRIVRCNGTFAAMVGVGQEVVAGRFGWEFFHPDSPPPDRASVDDLVAGRRDTYSVERLLRAPGGDPLPVQLDWAVLRDPAGAPHRLLCVLTDVSAQHTAHAELREARERAEVLWQQAPIGVVETTPDGVIVSVNGAVAAMLGRAPEDLVGLSAAAVAADEDRDELLDDFARLRLGGSYTAERTWLAADGHRVPVHVSAAVLHDDRGAVSRLAGFVVDMSEVTARTEEALAASRLFDAILAATPDFTFVTDLRDGSLVYSSPGKTILGRTNQQIETMGSDRVSLVHPDDLTGLQAANEAARELVDGEVQQFRYRARHDDGTWRWISRRVTPFRRSDEGLTVEVLGVVRDVTDVVEAEERLAYSALHDPLTGLPNRALLMDRLEGALTRARQVEREVAILYCDLDGFKRVNDTSGHAAGDTVLMEAAARLRSSVREQDTVARVGGDEFVVIVEPWRRSAAVAGEDLPGPGPSAGADRELVTALAERIAAALREPITAAGAEHVVTASVGITFAGSAQPGGFPSAGQVLQDADSAMYRAKHSGKDRFEVFEHGQRTDLAERGRIEHTLRRALGLTHGAGAGPAPAQRMLEPELTAVYQPIVDRSTGELVGYEALARLRDERGVDISPEVFINVAETSSLIRPLGLVMLELACAQLAAWRRESDGPPLTMAVNISALQAQHASLGDEVRRVLQAHGLSPGDLVLELTETALLQAANSTISALTRLRDDGVGIAIDDFGTGYASLRYLATLPITAVKVDRSFTAGLPHDDTCRKIVSAVIGLAKDLDLGCVVEGVESEVQRASLPTGVHLQGWLTGRPARAADLHQPVLN